MITYPLRIETKNGYATVYDANNNPVPFLSDVELGWTDTSTGNYHDSHEELEEIELLISLANKQADKELR